MTGCVRCTETCSRVYFVGVYEVQVCVNAGKLLHFTQAQNFSSEMRGIACSDEMVQDP